MKNYEYIKAPTQSPNPRSMERDVCPFFDRDAKGCTRTGCYLLKPCRYVNIYNPRLKNLEKTSK